MSDGEPDVVTSLVTPFTFHPDPAGGGSVQISERSWRNAVAFQRDSGIPAVAVADRFGEGATLSRWERKRLVQSAVEVSGTMRVLADVSRDEPGWSETYAIDAEAAGAHGLVLHTPSFGRANFVAVRRLVERVSLAVDIPLYVEFAPSASGYGLTCGEVSKLARIDGVAGLICHSSDPTWAEQITNTGKSFALLSADETSFVASRLFGASGFFSALANVAPVEVLQMQAACRVGDFHEAREIHEKLLPLVQAVRDDGVAALKYALLVRRGIEFTVRPPLIALGRDGRRRVEAALSSSLPSGTGDWRGRAREPLERAS